MRSKSHAAPRRSRRTPLVIAATASTVVLSFARLGLDSSSLVSFAAETGRSSGERGRLEISAAAGRRHPSADDLVCREIREFDDTDVESQAAAVEAACGCALSGLRGSGFSSFWDHPAIQSGIAEAAALSLFDCWNWDEAFTTQSTWGDRNTTIAAYTNRTDDLLAALPAARMRRVVRTRGRPAALRGVLELVLRRLSDPENNPPLKIAVFGGSVTEGFNCIKNDVGLPGWGNGAICAWPRKLERLLDSLLDRLLGGPLPASSAGNATRKVVSVTNFGSGGRDSSVAASIVEFDIIGSGVNTGDDPLSTYDVVISSFAANDGQAAPSDRERLYGSMQRFARLLSAQRPCDVLPLVVMVDDVPLETFRGSIRDGLRHAREMVEVSSRGGLLSVSYADLVREDAWLAGTRDGPVARGTVGELHPGAFFHTGLAWTVGHAILEGMLADGCDEAAGRKKLKNTTAFPPAWFVPPAIQGDTTEAQELLRYEQAAKEQAAACEGRGGNSSNAATSCTYKWLADRQSASSKEAVHEAVSKVATSVEGWEAIGFPVRKPRRTWQASRANATFVIQLDHIEGPINRLLILYIRSYGKLWEGSRLLVTVEGRAHVSADPNAWEKITQFDLSGVHDSKTSINYSHHSDLGALLVPGGGVRVTFQLVDGNIFQINGLALCQSNGITEGG